MSATDPMEALAEELAASHWTIGFEHLGTGDWQYLARVLAARDAATAERIARAMPEEFADRVTWGDGTEYIAVTEAQRIAREVSS